MMSTKPIINLVYSSQKVEKCIFNGPEGKAFMSNKRDKNRINIAVSSYIANKPSDYDGVVILEPVVVLPKDYQIQRLDRFNKVFIWCKPAFEGTKIEKKVVQINYPNIFEDANPNFLIKHWKGWDDRRKEIAIVNNGKKTSKHPAEMYSLRKSLADMFYKEKTIPLKWYGKSPAVQYKGGKAPDKLGLLRSVRFTICSENCYHPQFSWNYFTEKMMHAWMAGTAPMYLGCYNIDEMFPKESYIDLRPYVTKKNNHLNINREGLVGAVNSFNKKKFNDMMECVRELMKKEKGLFHICSWKQMCRTMLKSYS